jgi:hypothetical protein
VSADFPYVHIGEDQILPDTDQCHDAFSAFVTVHVWSRAVGKVEAKTIMARLPLRPGRQPATRRLPGDRHLGHRHPPHDRPDGLTSHSVATIRYRLGPV